jgi:hypothetical protein
MSAYIGNIPVPQATQTRQTFTATASQTTFNTVGYTAGFVDVYMNGVRLVDGTDFTATNGSTVVLTTGAAAGDVIEVVAYSTYQVNDQSFTGDFSVDTNTLYVDSTNNRVGVGTASPSNPFQVGTSDLIVDASGNLLVGTTDTTLYNNTSGDGLCYRSGASLDVTAASDNCLILNRNTTDGTIAEFRKDGTIVGGIGVSASDDFYIGASTANHAGVYFGTDIVYPMRANSLSDGVTSLGHSSNRFNNLYLSGGVYLGGTAAANALDDYEEGTFTPTSTTNSGTAATFATVQGTYTKIGNVVHFSLDVTNIDTTGTTSSSEFRIDGLPFTVDVDGTRAVVLFDNITFQGGRTSCVATISTAEFIQLNSMGTGIGDTAVDYGDLSSGVTDVFICGFYYTDQ